MIAGTGIRLAFPDGIKKKEKVLEDKTFTCIVCSQKFRSKAWVSRHFKTHETIPYYRGTTNEGGPVITDFLPAFTHPSCWPAEVMTWERIKAEKWLAEDAEMGWEPGADSPSAVAAYNAQKKIITAMAGGPQRRVRDGETKRLIKWYIWWMHSEIDIINRIDSGPIGVFQVNGTLICLPRPF